MLLDFLRKLREALNNENIVDRLLEIGVPLEVAEDIEKLLKGQSIEEILKKLLKEGKVDLREMAKRKKPVVIMVVGINGSGKTTTVAKLAYLAKKKGLSVVLAAADTFRAGAIEQLEEHGKRLGIKVIKHGYGADPAAVAKDALEHAIARGIDVVIIDTSGRLHTRKGLMEELKKIKRVVNPDLVLCVLDSTTGSDAVEEARVFSGLSDGFVLAKFDADSRGGVLLSVSHASGKPIYFLGVGQGYEDLVEFKKEEIIKAIVGK